MSGVWIAVTIVLSLAVGGASLIGILHRFSSPPETAVVAPPPVSAPAEKAEPLPSFRRPPEADRSTTPPVADPVDEAARRALDREKGNLALPPPTDKDGKVHLRSGGTVDRDLWDRASRGVRNSPVLQPPPTSPY